MYPSHASVMGPVSLVACHQQRVTLPPTASKDCSGEKLDTDPRIGQSSRCGLCQEPFFLGAVAMPTAVDDCTKGCYALTV
jgi:hypothetical protein